MPSSSPPAAAAGHSDLVRDAGDLATRSAAGSTPPARAFAAGRGLRAASRAACWSCPAPTARSAACCSASKTPTAARDPFLPGKPCRRAAGRHLSLRQRAARRAPRRARLRARRLSLHALPQGRGQAMSGWSVPDGVDARRSRAHRRGRRRWRATSINTPANDMGPAELEDAARALARSARRRASQSIVGDDLLTQNFPLIHAVGRASVARAAPDRPALGRRASIRR